jgi:hypothetical protein
MKAWYRTVNRGTCQALTGGGEEYIGNNLMFNVLSSSVLISSVREQLESDQTRTNGYHAFAIVIQIFHQHLAKTVNLALATFREISRQESVLFLQCVHHVGQFLYHTLVGAEILLLGQHHAEVKDELIAVVARRLHADWVSQYTISISADLEKIAAELLARDHEERDIGEG